VNKVVAIVQVVLAEKVVVEVAQAAQVVVVIVQMNTPSSKKLIIF